MQEHQFGFHFPRLPGEWYSIHAATEHRQHSCVSPESLQPIRDGGKSSAQFCDNTWRWLVDGTGFGKTITALLYITQMALYADHTAGHRPTALIVPNGAMFAQWCDTIQTHCKDLVLVISNDTKPADKRYWNHWISAPAMREARSRWEKDSLSISFTLQSLLLSQIQSSFSKQLRLSHLAQASITSIYLTLMPNQLICCV